MIDKFNNSPDVFIFLISTLAGGTGLNLTGANKVVIFGMLTFSYAMHYRSDDFIACRSKLEWVIMFISCYAY